MSLGLYLGLGVAGVTAVAALARRFAASRASWRFEQIPDQTGKIVLVTGANAGIGFQFCRHMLRKKAHIVMACRSRERGQAALDSLRNEYPGASVELRILDISSKKSIREFSAQFMKDFTRLDILLNNAGLGMRRAEIVEGIENTIATNSMGPFLLTGLLLPLLDKTDGARIVTVASFVHKTATFMKREQLGDISDPSFTTMNKIYDISKAMNLAFSIKLAKLLEERGSKTLSIAAHPGLAVTDFQGNMDGAINRFLATYVMNPLVSQSTEMGAAPLLMAATENGVKSGEYIGPCGWADLDGWPTRAKVFGVVNDPKFVEEQWKWCEEWTNFKY